VDGLTVNYTILDTKTYACGDKRDFYLPCSRSYYDCFVIGYSITSQKSFQDCISNYIPYILPSKHGNSFRKLPVVLIGNKKDLSSQREVTYAEGKALADEYGIPFFETSAKTRENVEEAMILLTREYWKKICKKKRKRKKKWRSKK